MYTALLHVAVLHVAVHSHYTVHTTMDIPTTYSYTTFIKFVSPMRKKMLTLRKLKLHKLLYKHGAINLCYVAIYRGAIIIIVT